MLDTVLADGPLYISLHDDDPGQTGINEVVGGSYNRQEIEFAPATDGHAVSSMEVEFTSMPAVTITHAGVWTAASGGDFRFNILIPQIAVEAGRTVRVKAGSAIVHLG